MMETLRPYYKEIEELEAINPIGTNMGHNYYLEQKYPVNITLYIALVHIKFY